MVLRSCAVFGLALLASGVALAEPIPEYALQKDYENCLGGIPPQQDPQRAQYCACMRSGMRGWSADAYAQMLIDQSKTQTIAPEVDALARTCVEKVFH